MKVNAMSFKPVYVTSQGLQELKEKLAVLQNEKRPAVLRRLQESKGGGDWRDSSEIMLFEEELSLIDSRIYKLILLLDHAELIEPDYDDDKVDIGERVVVALEDGTLETYTIVGSAEADPARGLISNESPLGRALLDHQVGEEVIVQAPVGELRYRIVGFAAKGP